MKWSDRVLKHHLLLVVTSVDLPFQPTQNRTLFCTSFTRVSTVVRKWFNKEAVSASFSAFFWTSKSDFLQSTHFKNSTYFRQTENSPSEAAPTLRHFGDGATDSASVRVAGKRPPGEATRFPAIVAHTPPAKSANLSRSVGRAKRMSVAAEEWRVVSAGEIRFLKNWSMMKSPFPREWSADSSFQRGKCRSRDVSFAACVCDEACCLQTPNPINDSR